MAYNRRDLIPEPVLHRPSSGITSPRSLGLLPFHGAFSASKSRGKSLFRRRPSPPVEPAPLNHVRSDINKTGIAVPEKVTFQWVKGELLGKGSYAKVYLGLNANTGEIMAVKQVELPQTPSDLMNSRHQEITDALKFERKTLMTLNHSHIVQYLGYEESPNYLSIFLEYVPGGTISSCLQTYGIFSEEVTKSFTHQMLEGLEYLHAMGIIHRDLKSDNILVEPSGICKISDFGISKQLEDNSQVKAYTGMRGTIYWMAPEILDNSGKNGYDVKVDIWSTGCVVLEMWTGQRPWFGEEIFPVMIKLSQEKSAPPIPPYLILTEAAFDFRNQCFQSDPRSRPSAAQLQNHRYLDLPPDWQFEPFELPSMDRPHSRTSRISRSTRYAQQSNLANTLDGIPSPPLISTVVDHSTIKTSTYRPNNHSESDAHYARSQPHIRQKSSDGPQVVFITPLNSPPSQISHLPNTSRSSLDTAGSVSTTRKGFRVINPDPEPQADRKPYVYHPPPLPSVDSSSPYSSRLLPLTQYGALEAHPHSVSSTPSASVQRMVSYSSDGHRTQSSYTVSDQPESDSDDDEIWAKPPTDLSTRGKLIQDQTRPVSRTDGLSRVTSAIGGHEEWPRPVTAAVYEHLQEFFPQYDLEKAVVPITSTDTLNKGGAERKKTIRVVAEDRAQSGARRRTKLWDSRVEELHM